MKRAFDAIEENEKYAPLYEAGLARERADWLVGINLTRAYTNNARRQGYNAIFRVGRVLIPTLALVVRREDEISNFHSKEFYELVGSFLKDNIPFKATFQPDDQFPTDEEGRVLDKNLLEALKEKLRNAKAAVRSIEKKKGSRKPSLPHSLDTLQVLANKRYDYSPKTVLDTVQKLYEAKLVSYPRSDCNYIPESQKTMPAPSSPCFKISVFRLLSWPIFPLPRKHGTTARSWLITLSSRQESSRRI